MSEQTTAQPAADQPGDAKDCLICKAAPFIVVAVVAAGFLASMWFRGQFPWQRQAGGVPDDDA
jgi:hypothetical protein